MSIWWVVAVGLFGGVMTLTIGHDRYGDGFQAGVTTTLCIQQAAEDGSAPSCDRLSKQQREYALSVAWEIAHHNKP